MYGVQILRILPLKSFSAAKTTLSHLDLVRGCDRLSQSVHNNILTISGCVALHIRILQLWDGTCPRGERLVLVLYLS